MNKILMIVLVICVKTVALVLMVLTLITAPVRQTIRERIVKRMSTNVP